MQPTVVCVRYMTEEGATIDNKIARITKET